MANIINAEIYSDPTLNIAIIGCISTGKSTFMNSLFAQTYSDMKIKKTTMCPQVYKTDKKIAKSKTYAKEIRKQNEELNKKLYEVGTQNKCEEISYSVLPITDIFNNLTDSDKIEYKIYDIPGLNDSATKNIFYDYIRKNFYKFDLVIYNIDINSGLNTTDELDILKLINECVTNIKKQYDKDIKLLVLCNKCDDMILNENSEIEGSEEIEEMYKQVCEIVKKNNIICPVIKYSAAYTYMYRTVNTPENLDKSYIDKIGIDNLGRVQWNKKSKGKTINELWNLIKPHLSENVDNSLELSGFNNLKKVLCKDILSKSFYEIMYSKIHFHTNPNDFMTKYEYLTKLDSIFKSKYGTQKINTYITKYIEMLKSKYTMSSIFSGYAVANIQYLNVTLLNEYFEILQKLNMLEISSPEIKQTISDELKKCNGLKAQHELYKIQTNLTIGDGSIFGMLEQIINRSEDGIKTIVETQNLNHLLKVQIDDFYKMMIYLKENNVDYTILKNLYIQKIINHFNTSVFREMIKNYVLKLYNKTNNETYNFIASCITINIIKCSDISTYISEYVKLISFFDEFLKFTDLYEAKPEKIAYHTKTPDINIDESSDIDSSNESTYVSSDSDPPRNTHISKQCNTKEKRNNIDLKKRIIKKIL